MRLPTIPATPPHITFSWAVKSSFSASPASPCLISHTPPLLHHCRHWDPHCSLLHCTTVPPHLPCPHSSLLHSPPSYRCLRSSGGMPHLHRTWREYRASGACCQNSTLGCAPLSSGSACSASAINYAFTTTPHTPPAFATYTTQRYSISSPRQHNRANNGTANLLDAMAGSDNVVSWRTANTDAEYKDTVRAFKHQRGTGRWEATLPATSALHLWQPSRLTHHQTTKTCRTWARSGNCGRAKLASGVGRAAWRRRTVRYGLARRWGASAFALLASVLSGGRRAARAWQACRHSAATPALPPPHHTRCLPRTPRFRACRRLWKSDNAYLCGLQHLLSRRLTNKTSTLVPSAARGACVNARR